MRTKIFFSMLVLMAVWLTATRAFAQEGNTNADIQELNSHPELNLGEDKTLIMDADAKPPKTSQPGRDSAAPLNAPKKQEQQKPTSNPTNDKTQEDPLSFNFLYFIIQKFKFSDIVDD
jgi:hypothetical protein